MQNVLIVSQRSSIRFTGANGIQILTMWDAGNVLRRNLLKKISITITFKTVSYWLVLGQESQWKDLVRILNLKVLTKLKDLIHFVVTVVEWEVLQLDKQDTFVSDADMIQITEVISLMFAKNACMLISQVMYKREKL